MNNNLTLHVAGETSELVKIFLVSSMNYCTEILVNDQNTYIHMHAQCNLSEEKGKFCFLRAFSKNVLKRQIIIFHLASGNKLL